MSGFNFKMVFRSGLSLSIIFCLLSACKKSADNTPMQAANEVWIQNMAFSPATLTVAVNTTVKWTNKDGVNHTVSSDSSWFDSGSIGSGGTYSRQFTVAGTYSYHCNIHAGMNGKVIVH